MAFTTKLNLTNAKVYQGVSDSLTLSGATSFIDAKYLTTPEITDALQIPNAGWVTGQTGAITAGNGLTRDGSTIILGGTLSGATSLDINGQSLTFNSNPITYGGDYSSQYTARSLVDAGYVTGLTSGKLDITDFNSYSSTTDTRLDTIESDISTNAGNIATNASDIATVSGLTVTNATNIATNASDIATVSGLTVTNATNIATNASDIATVSAQTETNTSDISTNAGNIATNASDIATVSGLTVTNATNIATNASDIAIVSGLTETNATNIATNASDIATNAADIATVSGLTVTNATNIATNASDIATVSGLTETNATDIATVSGLTVTNATNIATNAADILIVSGLTETNATDIATNAGDIATNAGNIATNTANISTVSAQTNTNTSNIATITGLAITGASNGLTKSSQDAILGGDLDSPTTININSQSLTITDTGGAGIVYADDYSSTYTSRSLVDKAYVDGSTGAISAANGLTKDGNVIKLGGTITGATTLDINNQSLTINTNPIDYGGDYSSQFIARSLVDAGYVTGLTSGLQSNIDTKLSITDFNSYSSTTDTRLDTIESDISTNAGNIATNTSNIATNAADIVTVSGLTVTNASNITTNSADIATITGLAITDASNGLTKSGQDAILGGNLDSPVTININSQSLTITDTGGAGIEYADDYSATFTNRSLVDKEYVDGAAGSISAGNGLTRSGDAIVLGGNLTGDTTIGYTLETDFLNIDASLCATNVHVIDFHNTPTITDHCEGRIYYDNCQLNFQRETSGVTLQIGEEQVVRVTNITGSQIDNGSVVRINGSSSGLPTITKSLAANLNSEYSIGVTTQNIANNNEGYVTTQGLVGGINTSSFSAGDVLYLSPTVAGGLTNLEPEFPNQTIRVGVVVSSAVDGKIFVSMFWEANHVDYGVFTGYTATTSSEIGGKLDTIDFNTYTGNTETTITDIQTITDIALTGATNGLTTSGRKVKLGGALTELTTIDGNFGLTVGPAANLVLKTTGDNSINIDAQGNGAVALKSQSGSVTTQSSFTNAIGIYADYDQNGGFVVYDNRVGSNREGLVYASDYSSNYDDRSLVDKAYVDTVATGLNAKAGVRAATTTNIDLTGGTFTSGSTIDGYVVLDGDRILVKDQTGATENGIWVFSGSSDTFYRAEDFDGTPVGEVNNGDLVPVISGDTHANTQWILTTPDPVTIGTDDLTFSLFSKLLQIAGGDGISINSESGVQNICVDLATNSGLEFVANALSIANEVAGSGLTWTTGVIDVNASATAISGTEVAVKFGTSNALVVDSADFQTLTSGNGVTISTNAINLGGTLTTDVTIAGSNTYNFSLNNLNSFNLGFDSASVITDNGTNGGLAYAADYSANYSNRSIPDVEFVYDTVTGSTLTYNNGLTKAGDTISWGGSLTGESGVILGTSSICVCSGIIDVISDCSCSIVTDTTMIFNTCTTSTSCVASITMDGAAGTIAIVANDNAQGITVTAPAAGIVYAGDYTANFGACSLVTKAYVDSATGGITAGNGLTRDGGTIILGGTLTGKTTINATGATFDILGYSGSYFCMYNVSTQANIDLMTIDGNYSSYMTQFAEDNSQVNMCIGVETGGVGLSLSLSDATGSVFTDSLYSQGLVYAACYHANYTSRSLVDADYVTGITSSIATDVSTNAGNIATNTSNIATITGLAITDASNGLTKSGQDAILGGTLTADTSIGGASTYDLNLTGLTVLNLAASGGINLTGAVTLQSTPATGSDTNDGVLVWNSTDKQIKQVSAANLGEDNNRYDVTAVNNSVINLTGNEYVVLVSTNSGAVTVNLPTTPAIGTAIKIKDKGNALANNITVDAGLGSLIDGTQTATINTDYGALELVYGEANSWYTLAFIN